MLDRRYTGGVAVTPDDNAVLTPTQGIYVGGTGDLELQFWNGSVVLLENVPDGAWFDGFCVVKVMEGTTATGVLALY